MRQYMPANICLRLLAARTCPSFHSGRHVAQVQSRDTSQLSRAVQEGVRRMIWVAEKLEPALPEEARRAGFWRE